jgi:hypothetical protein
VDRYDDQYYFTRKETDEHKSEIRYARKHPHENEILLARIFTHQRAVYGSASAGPGESQEPSDAQLASYFYNNLYIVPDLSRGVSGAAVNQDHFVENVLFSASVDHRNRISYLLGDVGAGKTSFINHLITTRGRSWIENQRRWFIRLDCDDAGIASEPRSAQIMSEIIAKTHKILTSHPELLSNQPELQQLLLTLGPLAATSASLGYSPEQAATPHSEQVRIFCDLTKARYEYTKRRLLLIIDNLDILCHLRDRPLCQGGRHWRSQCFQLY